ncbi:unnamed protein product, partial [Ceutorhynchus assimilis]
LNYFSAGYLQIDDSKRRDAPSESFFKVIYIDITFYYWLLLIISVVAIVANLFVVRSVLIRKYKYLQKTCIISLAISDILTVVTFCINYLDLLGKPLNFVWSSGEFLCWYNPVGQVLGNLLSSLALLVIALDRYHNVIYALNKAWNPKLWKCIVGVLLSWGLCLGISYPMATFYFHIPLRLPNGKDVYMCTGTSTTRGDITFYYVLVAALFFVPLITMFLSFYYKIAFLVWKHRKPVGSRTKIEELEVSSSTKAPSDLPNIITNNVKKKKNMQMQRKIRTFKIVIVLIFAFIFCRMPYWLYWLLKMLTPIRNSDAMWRLTLTFTALNLLNCAMNPFLYTYLNQSIYVCRKINECICTTCCCCFSNAEFDEYEKGKPFAEGVMGKVVATVEQPKANPYYERFPQVPHFPKYTSINRF